MVSFVQVAMGLTPAHFTVNLFGRYRDTHGVEHWQTRCTFLIEAVHAVLGTCYLTGGAY
jgi:hypothetical protein